MRLPSDKNPMQAHAKVWFERAGKVALSGWRVALLEAIAQSGSLSAGTARLGVPYRTAWYKLREIEEQLGVRLLDTRAGGPRGGGSTLTPAALEMVARFRRVQGDVEKLVRERFEIEFAEWSP